MKKVNIGKLLKNGKCLFLAYDQGLEHGPSDFDELSVNPGHIIHLAHLGGFNGLIMQKGIAEKYHKEIKLSGVPLIIKLNGKTNLLKGEPISTQLCSVNEAKELGASAVGYTIYFGSEHESEMLSQFEKVEMEAHKVGLPVILWAYPRGKSVEGKKSGELMAYSTRAGLELGADMVKLYWNGDEKDLKWAVKSGGKCKLVIAGGLKVKESDLLKQIKLGISSGVTGFAIGRNIWQSKHPLELTKKIRKVIWR